MDHGRVARPADPYGILDLRERSSDSPYVDAVWCSAGAGGPMTSVAASHREIVVWRHDGKHHLTVRGPETVPSTLEVPPGFTAFGIVLAHGTSMPGFPAGTLVDSAVDCPVTARGAFLDGEEWTLPSPETAEVFVERLVRAELLVRDPLVDDLLRGETPRLSARSAERRVRRATGLARGAIGRIERARRAAALLAQGTATADVVSELGYHDHPHLNRSLNRFVGHGPSWLRAPDTALSFPYKVDARSTL